MNYVPPRSPSLPDWQRQVSSTIANLGGLDTAQQMALPLRPEHFNAAGDGVTDDFNAWKGLIAQANSQGGARIELGKGKTYLLNQFVSNSNGVADTWFTNCRGLLIEGNGAKIKLKGGWDRATSDMRSLRALRFDQCQFVWLRNLEIDGGVSTITNSSGASVPSSFNISFNGCYYVILENVYTHHSIADGLNFGVNSTLSGGKFQTNRWVYGKNVISKFNIRLGMSPLELRNALFENCDFSYSNYDDENGTNPGFVGGGSPLAGVDIEPDYDTATTPTALDYLTGEQTYLNCRFIGNKGSSFMAASYDSTHSMYPREQIRCFGCLFDHPSGVTGNGIFFDTPDSIMEGCTFQMRGQALRFGYNASGTANQKFKNNTVYGYSDQSQGLFNAAQMTSGLSEIEGNTFIGTYTGALSSSANTPFQILNSLAIVRNNKFFLPAAAYTSTLADDRMKAVTMGAQRSEGNRYETDLTLAVGTHANANYYVGYDETVCVARNERFAGSSIGWTDTFRPGRRSAATLQTWDTNFLFASNLRMNQATTVVWAALANQAQQSTTVTVTDAAIGDAVDVRMSIGMSGTALRGEVTAANTVTAYQMNLTGGSVGPLASATLYATVTKRVL